MIQEVMSWLTPKSGGTYIDATLGAGGHAAAVLEESSPDGVLFGMDRDEDALAIARDRLAKFGSRATFLHAAFDRIAEMMREQGVARVDGILADLGVSSMQLDRHERGFSFMSDGPLDMRMDRSRGISAAEYIADVGEKDLADALYYYGEERNSRRIARRICEARRGSAIETTAELAALVARANPRRGGNIHPATRTFQALRIVVNDELGMLERFLEQAPDLLHEGGRLVILSYHSLEDRLVKRAFRERARTMGRVLTKKVVVPTREEIQRNPRARSAKLRAFEQQS